MNCPICLVDLLEMDRGGIEVDYCPMCRGVWLDRGELDKLISSAAAQPPSGNRSQDDSDEHSAHFRSRGGSSESHSRRKRGSFLSELFDFG